MQRITFFLAIMLQLLSSWVSAGNDWRLERDENSMQGYCKEHESGYKYCKIETIVPFTLKELVAINTDPDYLAAWMETVMHSEQIEKVSETDYVNYLQYDLPHPFRDRDSVTRTLITQDPQSKAVKMEFKTEPGIKKQSFEFEPMEFIFGYWKFTPVSQEQSKVEYAVLVLPGGNLHYVLFNPTAVDVPWITVQNMRKELMTNNKYKNPMIDFVDNF